MDEVEVAGAVGDGGDENSDDDGDVDDVITVPMQNVAQGR